MQLNLFTRARIYSMNADLKSNFWLWVLSALVILLTPQTASGQSTPSSSEQLRTEFETFLQQYANQEKPKADSMNSIFPVKNYCLKYVAVNSVMKLKLCALPKFEKLTH